jgi:type IV pilus assembly protein PilA
MKKQMQQGFTLIELMIVVAIIGILASIALPAYQDYVAKAQVSDPVTVIGGIKMKVLDYFQQEGACPDNTSAIPNYDIAKNDEYTSKYVSDILTAGTAGTDGGCTIQATFNDSGINKALQSKIITFQLFGADKGQYKWSCYTDIDATNYKLLPKNCRYTAHTEF